MGHWGAARRSLATPSMPIANQDQIFDVGDVGILSRLLSHLVIVGGSTLMIALLSVPLAIVTAVVLYVHIVCDVCWDIWRLGHYTDLPVDDLVDEMR